MTLSNAALYKTKNHFEVLDGLRGIAAIAVVTFHFMEIVFSDYSKNFIGHGFLAVDFFFCLSGFVIAYAYDDRIAKMGNWEFFKSRIIRLHPLVVLGSVLGLITFWLDPFSNLAQHYAVGKIALIFLASIFLIPFPAMAERYFNLFSLNAPAWSLFWEYVANIIYALILSKLNRRWLALLLIPAGISLCVVCYQNGNLMGGWAGINFWQGFARISYSFLAGMCVYRFNFIIKNGLGFLRMGILLAAAFLMPYSSYNYLTETVVVLFWFPFLIALGAGTHPSQGLQKLCNFFGNLSYPLYMTHYAALFMFANYYSSHKPATGELTIVVITGILFLIFTGYLAMTLYDIPVRKWLNSRKKTARA